ncbi:cellulose synthase-like protein D4-like [Hibiscus syriacus]|uniref:Cellulose synthase-like protein D4-like n=1 Tax=Hibiscus syriacus TaxID=106335 RepID=A0A6A3B8R1_HIBSY|nr:uncharacterized protein LOC120115825 [Hibiscus syriacus]KAE8711765.1 cellulose synthase-like protein D4-like [Hibiscus syriacus]
MEDCMRLCMRKLALWYTKTFKPLMTHDELEPIMATMGFVGLPLEYSASTLSWKEYVYSAPSPGFSSRWSKSSPCSGSFAGEPLKAEPPRPKLPYPRIDGLHIYTYRAFLDAVNFYLEMCDISELFHIRGMPLYRNHDRSRKWRCMEEDDSLFVYREGTLEQTIYNLYHFNKTNSNSNGYSSVVIRDKGNNDDTVSCVVPLKDIIV